MPADEATPSRGHLWLNLAALVLPWASVWLLSGLLLLLPLVPIVLAVLGLLNSIGAIAAEKAASDDAETAAERARHFAIFSLSLSGIGLVITLFAVVLLAGEYP